MENSKNKVSVILFDGVCNLCNAWVQFIISRDPSGKFHFASLQSEAAQKLLKPFNITVSSEPETVIVIDQGRCLQQSSAILKICSRLRLPWTLLSLFWIVPRPLRDYVYGMIARNRYRWFGRQNECMLPRPEWKSRFLD